MTAEPWVFAAQMAEHLGVMRELIYRQYLSANPAGRSWKFKLFEVGDRVRAGGAGEA